MPVPRDISFKRRLRHVIMLTSTVALGLACAAIIGFQFVAARHAAVRDLTALATVIAANSSAALTFHDPHSAEETLASLKTNPGILAARIYNSDGTLFAQYVAGPEDMPLVPPHQQIDGHWFQQRQLILSRKIRLDDDIIGTVVLRHDMREEYTRLRDYVTIVTILMLASTCVALLLSAKLQNVITQPILELVRVARGVIEEKDYSLRARGNREDEVGLLVEAFNHMLDRIQERNQELAKELCERKRAEERLRVSEQRFRQLAEHINEVFWLTDTGKTEMIYISPAYEKIWGRSCESLYQKPLSWVEAIHPDDRKRVLQAAIGKQVEGMYDEEYRILRPSGALRWIRDRAYPVFDEQGHVYRIAGIAEDITERKLAVAQLAMLAQAVEGTAELICITDLQDHFIFANRAFEKAHGYSKDEILGKTPAMLYSPRNPPSLLAEVLEQTRRGGWQGEVLDLRKDGSEFQIGRAHV